MDTLLNDILGILSMSGVLRLEATQVDCYLLKPLDSGARILHMLSKLYIPW